MLRGSFGGDPREQRFSRREALTLAFPNSMFGYLALCHPYATAQEQSHPVVWARDSTESPSMALSAAGPCFSAALC